MLILSSGFVSRLIPFNKHDRQFSNSSVDQQFIEQRQQTMKADVLSFQAVTHLSEADALELTKKLNAISFKELRAREAMPPPPKLGVSHAQNKQIQGHQEVIRTQKNNAEQPVDSLGTDLHDSLINGFDQNVEVSRLKEQISRIWYEKMALEAKVKRLKEENLAKDEVIRSMQSGRTLTHGLKMTPNY